MYVQSDGTVTVVSPTLDTAAYGAGDLVGGKLTLTDILPAGGAPVSMLVSAVVVDQANQKAALDLVFWKSDPSGTTFTDQAALDVADADNKKIAGVVSVLATDYVSFADNAIATVKTSLPLFSSNGSRTLYMAVVSRGTPTYATATDMQITLTVI